MDYETFTREKIARLRADADALERHLKEFLAITARSTGGGRRLNAEGSAIGTILNAIEASGPAGLTLDQMLELASDQGFEVKRNTLRSQLWTAKNEGRVVQLEPGRYAAAAPSLPSIAVPQRASIPVEPRTEPTVPATAPRETFTADLDDEIPF